MKLGTPYHRSNREHLGPLVDVVFLLLVFFMLAGHITSPDPLAVEPPESTAKPPVDPPEMLILLTADGRLALDGQEITPDVLGSLLKSRLAERTNPTIDLKADAGVATGEVMRVMTVLREAGVQNVRLLTRKANRQEDGG